MTITTDSTKQTSACPPWCTFDHEGDPPGDLQHLSEMAEVPCLVTKREDGHICGGTNCSDPAYNEPECDRPNFAQLVADNTGVTIEVGHGDDLLPAMTPGSALALAAGIAELARLGGGVTAGGQPAEAAMLREALEAVREAVCIPFAATVGDERTRAEILDKRVMHLRVFLDSVLDPDQRGRSGLARDIGYLREKLADNPAQGYRTWDEAVTEMRAAGDQA